MSNFLNILNLILQSEGGYSDDPHDRGGATNLGITRKTLAKWRGISPWWKLPKSEVKNLTKKEATAIYKALFWNKVRGEDLPAGLDLSVFDAAVNSGPPRAIKWLQTVVGVKQDGIFGPLTMTGIDRSIDMPELIGRYNDKRLSFMQSLRSWQFFKNGWARRVAEVRAKSIAMWMQSVGVGKPSQIHVLQTEIIKAKQVLKEKRWFGLGFAVFGGAFGLWNIFINGNWLTWLAWGGIMVMILVIIYRIVSFDAQAKAFETEKKKVE